MDGTEGQAQQKYILDRRKSARYLHDDNDARAAGLTEISLDIWSPRPARSFYRLSLFLRSFALTPVENGPSPRLASDVHSRLSDVQLTA